MRLIVAHLPIKHGWRDAPFVLRDFSRGNKQSWISQHENLDRSSWKFRPFNMKITTVQHENLGRSSWKSGPFIMEISTTRNKISAAWNNISTGRNKISTVLHENKSQLLAEMTFHTCGIGLKVVREFPTCLLRYWKGKVTAVSTPNIFLLQVWFWTTFLMILVNCIM